MCIRRRICGLALFSFGIGMFLGLLAHGWAFIFAAILLLLGFWLLFI